MLNKLKKMKIQAMRDKENVTKNILSLLHSDALNIAKKELRDVCDSDIIKSAKSLIKKNEQTISMVGMDAEPCRRLSMEIGILEKFLPVQMSEEDIKLEVMRICHALTVPLDSKPARGMIMKELKKFGDNINMGIANKYVTEELK